MRRAGADSTSAQIKEAAATLSTDRAAFLERLILRAFLHADGDVPSQMDGSVAPGMLEALRQAYLQAGPEQAATSVVAIDPKAWLGLSGFFGDKSFFGGDRSFIAKLARKTVRAPTKRALRDLADMLGISLSRVRDHFAAGSSGLGQAGVEMKSSVKPRDHARENFKDALHRSSVPTALK